MSAVLQVASGPKTSAFVSVSSRRWKQTVGDNYGLVTRKKANPASANNKLPFKDGILRAYYSSPVKGFSVNCVPRNQTWVDVLYKRM